MGSDNADGDHKDAQYRQQDGHHHGQGEYMLVGILGGDAADGAHQNKGGAVGQRVQAAAGDGHQAMECLGIDAQVDVVGQHGVSKDLQAAQSGTGDAGYHVDRHGRGHIGVEGSGQAVGEIHKVLEAGGRLHHAGETHDAAGQQQGGG